MTAPRPQRSTGESHTCPGRDFKRRRPPYRSAIVRQFDLRDAAIAAKRDPSHRQRRPGFTVAPLARLVKKERGPIRLIGTVANPLSPGFTFACGVLGMR